LRKRIRNNETKIKKSKKEKRRLTMNAHEEKYFKKIMGLFIMGIIICMVFIYLIATRTIVNNKGKIGGPMIEYFFGK